MLDNSTSHRIDAETARPYFSHASQRRGGLDPADLHDNGLTYYARDGVCLAFHRVYWPDVWMGHFGVMPEAWGRVADVARGLLVEFWMDHAPKRVIGWTPQRNRAALAMVHRVGFVKDGEMNVDGKIIEMSGWCYGS